MMTIMELPEDLLEEILCRVPALSLIRLRSTCKRWNRLINDKRFSPIKVKGILSLIDPCSSLNHIKISRVFHCDGLLLCVTKDRIPRLVVWNPCTGQTRWIKINRYRENARYALGYYQDKNSNVGYSYKILSYIVQHPSPSYLIYEMKSNSWRVLEVDATSDFKIWFLDRGVSLKGKTYWIAEGKGTVSIRVASFDYSKERFEYLCLPHQYDWYYETQSLSVVRGEKLSVLLQDDYESKTNIWVSSKISDETKAVS
ncbi:unnamed protein product [Microthlaspi erraticum]|uniref:F-box domain-containing protein n=1 Tax=Microthlaspi erraticum TaxID=1685480 RepID=A0A6D2HN42_9BRAS|nr:unnamed protein product [Microthlaspi erraticum]